MACDSDVLNFFRSLSLFRRKGGKRDSAASNAFPKRSFFERSPDTARETPLFCMLHCLFAPSAHLQLGCDMFSQALLAGNDGFSAFAEPHFRSRMYEFTHVQCGRSLHEGLCCHSAHPMQFAMMHDLVSC